MDAAATLNAVPTLSAPVVWVTRGQLDEATAEVFAAANKLPAGLPHTERYKDGAMQFRQQALRSMERGDNREAQRNIESLKRLKAEIQREWS